MSSVTLIIGPVFVGTVLNWALQGLLTGQIYQFKILFPKEKLWIKCLVHILFMLNLIQTLITTSFAWDFLVSGWGSQDALKTVPWSGTAHTFLTSLISTIVQIFFSWRIWILKRSSFPAKIVSGVITLVSLTQFISAIVDCTKTAHLDINDVQSVTILVEIWLIGSFAADILIALAMIAILAEARSNSLQVTNDILVRLMINTIETGALTAVTAGIDLILFLKSPDTFLHLCPSLVLGKLYTVAVIARFNSRKGTMGSYSNSNQQIESHQLVHRNPALSSAGRMEHSGINIHTSTVVLTDQGDLSNHPESTKYPHPI